MKYIIGIFILLTLLFSCTKFGKNITVTGRVLNPITGKGYPDVQVRLIKGTLDLPGGYKGVKSVWTDSHGRFEINHAGGVMGYAVRVNFGSDVYPLGWDINGAYNLQPLGVTKGKKQNVDYHGVPYGNMILHLRNDNCVGPNDTLQLYLDGSDLGYDDVQIGLLTELYGCIDITDAPVKFPMGQRNYHWVVTRNGVQTTHYGSVYIQPNQTTTFEIFY